MIGQNVSNEYVDIIPCEKCHCDFTDRRIERMEPSIKLFKEYILKFSEYEYIKDRLEELEERGEIKFSYRTINTVTNSRCCVCDNRFSNGVSLFGISLCNEHYSSIIDSIETAVMEIEESLICYDSSGFSICKYEEPIVYNNPLKSGNTEESKNIITLGVYGNGKSIVHISMSEFSDLLCGLRNGTDSNYMFSMDFSDFECDICGDRHEDCSRIGNSTGGLEFLVICPDCSNQLEIRLSKFAEDNKDLIVSNVL